MVVSERVGCSASTLGPKACRLPSCSVRHYHGHYSGARARPLVDEGLCVSSATGAASEARVSDGCGPSVLHVGLYVEVHDWPDSRKSVGVNEITHCAGLQFYKRTRVRNPNSLRSFSKPSQFERSSPTPALGGFRVGPLKLRRP